MTAPAPGTRCQGAHRRCPDGALATVVAGGRAMCASCAAQRRAAANRRKGRKRARAAPLRERHEAGGCGGPDACSLCRDEGRKRAPRPGEGGDGSGGRPPVWPRRAPPIVDAGLGHAHHRELVALEREHGSRAAALRAALEASMRERAHRLGLAPHGSCGADE